MKALILAAGLGTRLLPYTKKRPKPLFTLGGGTPVLKLAIDKLVQAGCTDIIINTHHLHQQIEQFIKKTTFSVHVETRHEPELLGTGGAIKNVEDFMGRSPFFVINSDIVSDIDLKKVWDFHIRGNWLVTLVMHNYREFNKVAVNKENFITGFQITGSHTEKPLMERRQHDRYLINHFSGNRQQQQHRTLLQHDLQQKRKVQTQGQDRTQNHNPEYVQFLAFTGIQVLSKEIFQYMPLKNKFSSIDIYADLADRDDKKVKAYICKAPLYWNDIGTVETYKKACMTHLFLDRNPGGLYETPINSFKNKSFHTCCDVVEESLDRPHGRNIKTLAGKSLTNPGNPISIDKQYLQYFQEILRKLEIVKLKGDGSSREWFRVHIPENALIQFPKSKYNQSIKFHSLIMGYHGICSENGEIQSFIAIGKHLFSIGIPVPRIYGYDLFSGMVALEDLGDIHLQNIINELNSEDKLESEDKLKYKDKLQYEDEIIRWYKKICNHLIDFSIKGIKNFKRSWTCDTYAYTKQLILEKECQYFINAFICGYLKKNIKFEAIKESCEFIADNAVKDSFTGLIHRDMQSRNIMVKNGQIFFIDFQGARKGPFQYDLASLLIDPYVNLNRKIREKILSYCAIKINKLTGFDQNKFIRGFRFCAITRNMQILGAFSFLSMVKGKKSFENYIPCALNTLKNNMDLLIDLLNDETPGQNYKAYETDHKQEQSQEHNQEHNIDEPKGKLESIKNLLNQIEIF